MGAERQHVRSGCADGNTERGVTYRRQLLAERRARFARCEDANHAACVRDGLHGVFDLQRRNGRMSDSSEIAKWQVVRAGLT